MRVPSVALTPPNERSSFCLFPELTTREITETPGYPQPVPKPRLPDLFHIKPASGMGLGVFAKHAIKVHELIFAERPLLVCPVAIPFPPGLQTKGLTEAEVFRKCINHGEGLLKQMVEMMTPEDAKTFRSLNNCHQESGETLFGIMRSNGIDVEITQRECEDERGGYAAIGKVGSRFNHKYEFHRSFFWLRAIYILASCMSNVTVDFDVKSFSMKYMAKRDIDAGEQIFYSYCDNMQPAKKRRKDLETYGFLCQCMGCVNATPESDKLRQELEDRVVKLFRGRQAMFADPKFNIRSLDSLLKLEKDVMKERLETHNIFPYLLYVILEGYMTLGNPAKVKGYEKKIAKYNAPSK